MTDMKKSRFTEEQIIGFLSQSRLFSPFGLRVGTDGLPEKSTTYALQFTVNQGHQSGV
jgi:hypothetical protein